MPTLLSTRRVRLLIEVRRLALPRLIGRVQPVSEGAVKQDVLQTGSLVGGALAALTSAAASICCIGPLAIMLLGVNGAIWAAGMKPYRPFLLTVSFVLLGLGFWGFYGRGKTGAGAVCSVASRRVGRWVLWVSAVLWIGAVTIQFLADRFWL